MNSSFAPGKLPLLIGAGEEFLATKRKPSITLQSLQLKNEGYILLYNLYN